VSFWLLPVCWVIGFGVAYLVVSGLEGVYDLRPWLARVAAEVGVAQGTVYWGLACWLSPSGHSLFGAVRQIVWQIAVTAALWSLFSWPFTMWELERRLKVPYYRCYDIATRMCGVTLLLLLLATGVERILVSR